MNRTEFGKVHGTEVPGRKGGAGSRISQVRNFDISPLPELKDYFSRGISHEPGVLGFVKTMWDHIKMEAEHNKPKAKAGATPMPSGVEKDLNKRISEINKELAGETGELIQSLPKISAMIKKLFNKPLLELSANRRRDTAVLKQSVEEANDVLKEFLDFYRVIQLAVKHYNSHRDATNHKEILSKLRDLEDRMVKIRNIAKPVAAIVEALAQTKAAVEGAREAISKYRRIVGVPKYGARNAVGKQKKRMERLEKLRDELESKGLEMTPERLDEICRKMTQVEEELSGGNLELRVQTSASTILSDFGIGKHLHTANLNFIQVHEICNRLAWGMAEWCFDDSGNVDRGKAVGLRNFLANGENFEGFPYDQFPYLEHMRLQMFAVLGHLVKSPSELENILNDTNGADLGSNGKAILATIGKTVGAVDIKPQVAILLSLFSPHRQTTLPTCTINSIINAELCNHPERLAKAYVSILTNKPNCHAQWIRDTPIAHFKWAHCR